LEYTGRVFEDKLQKANTGNVINRDLGNLQHAATKGMRWDQQTEECTY